MVRYTLRQGTQTLYNGTSRTDSANLAKSLGYVRIAGKPPTADSIVEEVGTLNGIQTYYWHLKK
jgi:hypothetical protein